MGKVPTNFVQLQYDAEAALLSAEALASIPFKAYRKLRMEKEIDLSTIYLTQRADRSGAGGMVEMPTFEVEHPNLPGPEGDVVLPVLVLEEPNFNMEPATGTLLSAEDICQLVLDTLHGLGIEGLGTLYADRNAIREATDEPFHGLVAYRVFFRVRMARNQTQRVATPAITEEALQVSFTCATADAVLYYTLDGSFPGPANPKAGRYAGQFLMTGTVLRWAAYKTGMLGSCVGEATVPA